MTKDSAGQNQVQDCSPDQKAYIRRRRTVSILSFCVLLAFIAVVAIVVGKPLIQMLSRPEEFQKWVDSHHIWGRLAFVGMMCLQVVFAIIPGEPMEIGAGYAFGSIEGTLLCLLGAAVGSSIIYLFTKKFGIKLVEAFISREKILSMSFIKNTKKLNLLIFILFFIPGTPKDIFTYFIGLTPMKLHVFLLISSIARIPSVITSTISGDALVSQNYGFAIAIFVITAIISAVGILIYHKIAKKHAAQESLDTNLQ